MAEMKAVPHTTNGYCEFGRCRLDLTNRFLWHNQDLVDLPHKAIELLCLLAENDGAVVSKDTIWQAVWQNAYVEETNLTHNIYLIRRKFKKLGEPDPIQTVPRRGYRFAPTSLPSNAIVIEHHAITQTLIEELPSEDPTPVAVRRASPQGSGKHLLIGGVLVVALVSVIVGMAFWRVESRSGTETNIRSVAVIPFTVVNATSNRDHEGAGLTDVLITRLSSIKGLRVSPTSAVMDVEGRNPIEVGKSLGVDAILEGMLYRQNEMIRVTARLVRLDDNYVVWSGQFEKSSVDELKLQNEIAVQVVNTLATNLSSAERTAVTKIYTENTDAWHTYTKARFEWSKRSYASMLEAQRLFRNAIAQDPHFALAYTGLADTLATGPDVTEANTLVRRALEIDPTMAEAHASLGFIQMFHGWDWVSAESSFRKSIELNPNYATAHQWYATLLAIKGRNDEAKAEMQKALLLNPISPNFLADLGQIYYFNKEYAMAERLCLQALQHNSEFVFAHEYLHDIYLLTGEYEKAVEAELAAQRINGSFATESEERKRQIVRELDLQRALFREKGITAFEHNLAAKAARFGYLSATRYAAAGKTDVVVDNLKRSVQSREFLAVFMKADPLFEPYSQDPTFRSLAKDMGLN